MISPQFQIGRRILVIGSPGAGKTTLGQVIARTMRIPHVQLDDLYWLQDWRRRSDSDWSEVLLAELQRDCWLLDGNYTKSMALRAAYADTIIHLDLPSRVCLFRAVRRAFLRGMGYIKDLPISVRNQMKPKANYRLVSFLLFVAVFRSHERPKIMAAISSHPNQIRLSSLSQVRALRNSLEVDRPMAL